MGRVKVQCDLKKSVTGNIEKQEKEGENADLKRKYGYVIYCSCLFTYTWGLQKILQTDKYVCIEYIMFKYHYVLHNV